MDAVLGELRDALEHWGAAVLVAPPGAGKTTRVPLDLLAAEPTGRIVVLEPRRVAARAAAARLAATLGERVGATVGLTTRDERRTSPATRLEVVTEGVLLRRIQRDPTLEGVGTLVFDEFHERNLEADLALAFALEARAAFRMDLRLLVTSATLAADRVAGLLGPDIPVVRATGRSFPMRIEHRPRPAPRELTAAIVAAVADLLAETPGEDVLVFLPGRAEIGRAVRALREHALPGAPSVLPLHGGLSSHEQDAALAHDPDGPTRIVVATDLAETSLTIPGVTAVVDAGLAREPRFDAATEMTGLVTVAASRAAATQRAGRAARLGPGRCIRLWPEREHAGRDAQPRPAIATDDLTGAALDVAAWGAEVADLALLDQPSDAAWARAHATLRELGALDAAGRVTPHGRVLTGLPLHPRLGHLLVRGTERGHGVLAAEVAAVLADRDPLVPTEDRPDADLVARIRWVRSGRAPAHLRARRGARQRLQREVRRLTRIAEVPAGAPATDPDRAGELVLLGWPDRLAAARPDRRGGYLLAGGRGAELPEGDPLAAEPWLAVAALDRGATAARIHLAAAVGSDAIEELLGHRVEEDHEVAWRDGDVRAERRRRIGALVLERTRDAAPPPGLVAAAVRDGLAQEGTALLHWTDDDRQFRTRLGLLHTTLGAPWPDVRDEALLADDGAVLLPWLAAVRRRSDLARVRVRDVLLSLAPPGAVRDLDRLVPSHLDVPSGRRVALDYTQGQQPVLAVRVQEVFGSASSPTVVDGRVPVLLHLLSPAGRPVQVTADLAGFWAGAYGQVRAELRGRYPKHDWPEDPTAATPARGSRRKR